MKSFGSFRLARQRSTMLMEGPIGACLKRPAIRLTGRSANREPIEAAPGFRLDEFIDCSDSFGSLSCD